VGVCLLLAVLFLYNPFFTIYGSPAHFSVKHTLSYRGTVASSELRRSLIQQVQPNVDAPQEAEFEVIRALQNGSASYFYTSAFYTSADEPSISTQDIFSAALWFRPPPAL
jgi:hypothetical protein